MKLGRLKKIDLREQWNSEAQDFTPWLAKNENIELLGETLGIELEVQGQEENVGPFRADILCLDTSNDNYVLIENQLERTDHNHLGQLITYAAGLDAVSIVWIAKNFTEEHRAALDWLNNKTDDSVNFFGIEVELFKIGDSEAAANFKLVSKPNDWSKSVRQSAASGKITETKVLQQEYWMALKIHLESNGSALKSHKPSPQHWTNFAIGKSYFHISATVNTRENFIGVSLNLTGPEAKTQFHELKEAYGEDSYKAISTELEWREMEGSKQSQIEIKLHKQDIMDRSKWPEQHEWFQQQLEAFTKFFKPKIRALK